MAIPTALFLVLVLFGLITAIQLQSTQNLKVTRQGHGRTQALFLARAVADFSLQRLQTQGGFYDQVFEKELELSPEALPSLGEIPAGAELTVTLAPSPTDPDLLYLTGLVSLPGIKAQEFTRVLVRRAVTGNVFAKRGGDIGITIFIRPADTSEAGPAQWTMLPPLPNRFYAKTGAGMVLQDKTLDGNPDNDFAAAQKVVGLAGDSKGNLYAIYKRDGPDTVFKLDTTAEPLTPDDWKPLPPVPDQYYKADGTLMVDTYADQNTALDSPVDPEVPLEGEDPPEVSAEAADRLKELATDGEDRLFARFARKDEAIDTLYMLDQDTTRNPGGKWVVLPPTPKSHYAMVGGTIKLTTPWTTPPSTGLAFNLKDLAADGNGNLFARFPRDDIDTIYKFEPGSDFKDPDNWKVMPEIPRLYYERVKDGGVPDLKPFSVNGKYAQNLKGLSVNSRGELFAVYNREGVDTLFGFHSGAIATKVNPPDPLQVPGSWKELEPVTRNFLKNATTGQEVDDSTSGASSLRNSVIDGDDNLYVYWRRDGIDSVFRYDTLAQNGYELLPPMPNKWWRRKGPEPILVDKSGAGGNKGVVKNVQELAAGGKPGGSGGYVGIASF
ncbi:MAG: hypothetical protein HY319_11310 [Armatimonadetes bacterium]|nr:hypothetical protein [Armatimonadota bacterium]